MTARTATEVHEDAVADTGDGYSIVRETARRWRVSCLWCELDGTAATKRDAVALIHEHYTELGVVVRYG